MENYSEGWNTICDNFFDEKCHIFKIPHHGSENGYNRNVWSKIVDTPISIITRFNLSHLLTEAMIEKIKKGSSVVYVVGPTHHNDKSTLNQSKKYDNSEMVLSMSLLDYDYGYVKLSKLSIDNDWTVKTYGAVKVYS